MLAFEDEDDALPCLERAEVYSTVKQDLLRVLSFWILSSHHGRPYMLSQILLACCLLVLPFLEV
jgi:hypothetical protein